MPGGPLRIAVAGAAGRMGRMLVAETVAAPDCQLAAAFERDDCPVLGQPAAAGIAFSADPEAAIADVDVLIDFTTPAATVVHAGLAARHRTALVVGTTGMDEAETATLAEAAKAVPVVFAPNFSVGVNLLFALVEKVAATLPPEWDVEILEMHHRAKVDAPSGTALGIGKAAARGRGVALKDHSVTVRDGHTGPRPEGAIGFATLRGGDVVGDHTALFAGPAERLELTHRAGDRAIFARGAVRAARWAAGQPPGLYGMADVLGLKG